jgi:flavin reductase (DIM6/NTAB) family NADH-FMN oxidoreductase RutF
MPPTLFNAIVAPRPIGWISSISPSGEVNLAPFSYFNGISSRPPMVMFACNRAPDRASKDTLANLRARGEFVFNFVSRELGAAMNLSSAPLPHGGDEFAFAGLERAPSRVAASPASLECRVLRIVDLDPDETGRTVSSVVIGRVVGVHLRADLVDADGGFDTVAADPIVRMGGTAYAALGDVFQMARPDYP